MRTTSFHPLLMRVVAVYIRFASVPETHPPTKVPPRPVKQVHIKEESPLVTAGFPAKNVSLSLLHQLRLVSSFNHDTSMTI